MHFREAHKSSTESSPESDETSVTAPAASVQPFGLYISAVATTQIAFFEFMSQCTLAWINASTGHPIHKAPSRNSHQSQPQLRVGSGRPSRAVKISAGELLTVPVITGLEETLSDQFIKPRPAGSQESEVLALWERSNEFEAAHGIHDERIATGQHDLASHWRETTDIR